ncbi:hypothetical protein K438DRAFT_1815448, partial [Mycena galopus ATCC 62051]
MLRARNLSPCPWLLSLQACPAFFLVPIPPFIKRALGWFASLSLSPQPQCYLVSAVLGQISLSTSPCVPFRQ